jgi:nitrite reductase/ring-hydroxylating ferredoxin subunit/multimeric flavodoxin WrbA
MAEGKWFDVGSVEDLGTRPVTAVRAGTTPIALVHREGAFTAISGACNHVGGPLGEGRLDGEYVVCPWHQWKFHHRTGEGEPGFEEDRVPSHAVKVEGGRVLVDARPRTPRHKAPHEPHPLARPVRREPGPLRVAGISTTVMDRANPRYSGSEELLAHGIAHAGQALGAETRLLRLGELKFRACEGYYSKSARACTWPCSITQMDPADQLDRVYEAIVHWADVFLVATPIRWGAASSLYFKMVERMNCIQNQVTIANRVLLRNKVAAFIITGGQDNVQAVAGMMMGFFGELGCQFPQFPFVAHSRGWSAEDMEHNVDYVKHSRDLREGAEMLAARAVHTAEGLLAHEAAPHEVARGGRKAHRLELDEPGEGKGEAPPE